MRITEDIFGMGIIGFRRVLMSHSAILQKWALPGFISNTLKLFALCELIIIILG